MKKSLAITSLVAASATAAVPGAQADDSKLALKQFGASSVALAGGAAIGGPVGLLFGGIGAVFVSDQMSKAERAEVAEQERAQARDQIVRLQEELHKRDLHAKQLRELALDSLQMQVHFHSGKDDLTPRNLNQIDRLAEVLQENPELQVRLIGHADARGTDGYNQILSEYRTRNVEERLQRAGVSPDRIERRAYGADRATAAKGDEEGYALDRHVAIEVYYSSESREGVARAY